MKITGFCTSCGASELELEDGLVWCRAKGCPDPRNLQTLLENPTGHLHVIKVRGNGWTIAHPVSERTGGGMDLFHCALHGWMESHDAPPVDPGDYYVRAGFQDDWVFIPK